MDEIDNVDVETTETDTDVDAQADTTEQTDRPAKEDPEAKLARLERQTSQLRKKLGKDQPKTDEPSSQTNELDLSALGYLRSALGIKGQAEIGLVKEYLKAGKTVLDLEDNRHFMNDLKDLRDTAETKAATPTSSRRSSNGGQNDFDIAYSKFKETGKLPDDFKLRSAIVNAEVDKNNASLPPWQRR